MIVAALAAGLGPAGCGSTPDVETTIEREDATRPERAPDSRDETKPVAGAVTEIFPHVRIDLTQRALLIDATSIFDLSGVDPAEVWLEVIVCTPDTREHEAVLLSSAQAAHVHAGLLLLGLEPGSPGRWERVDGGEDHRRVPPTGPAVDVDFILERDGTIVEEPAASWVINALTGESMGPGRFIFAGSRIVQVGDEARYDADWEGTLVGLATFGAETIGWSNVISPDSAVDEPVWIINADRYPPPGTSVTVRIRPARDDTSPVTP
jgi:hypothetical protein